MLQTCRGARALLTAIPFICLFSISAHAQTSQWTGPDASNNLYNNNTGYVGIGTTTPRTNLDVNGYLNVGTGISVGANSFSSNIPSNGFTFTYSYPNGIFTSGSGSGFGIKFRTSLTDRLTITDATTTIANVLVLPSGAGAGKVLTSDASGNATWQTAVSSGSVWSLTGNSGLNPSTSFLGTTDNSTLAFRTGNTERMRIDGTTGNVAIGTPNVTNFLFTINNGIVANTITPLALFGYSNIPANRSIVFEQLGNTNTATQYFFLNGGLGSNSVLGSPYLTSIYAPTFGMESSDANLSIITAPPGTNVAPIRAMTFLQGGNVLIGKTSQSNAGYILDVNGNGRLNEVVVNTSGADYVFDSVYRLSSLHDLETYVTREHHLPGIAPALQMQQEGLDLGDNQTRLLAKIEELTLYLIKQDKEINALKEENHQLDQIKQRLAALEQKLQSK